MGCLLVWFYKTCTFKCAWLNVTNPNTMIRWMSIASLFLTLIDYYRQMNIMYSASQVRELFYVKNPSEKDWHVVIRKAPCELYNIPEKYLKVEDDVICSQN